MSRAGRERIWAAAALALALAAPFILYPVFLMHYLARLGSWVTVIEGVIFVFCVLALRRGIVGTVSSLIAGRRKAAGRAAAPAGEREIRQATTGSAP